MKKAISIAEIRDTIRSNMEYDHGVITEASESVNPSGRKVASLSFVIGDVTYFVCVTSNNPKAEGEAY